MSTPELVARVAQQLAQISHEGDCLADMDYHGVEPGSGHELDYRCSCDRDQRVAAAVARAIEAAAPMPETPSGAAAVVGKHYREAALEALGASPQPETRP